MTGLEKLQQIANNDDPVVARVSGHKVDQARVRVAAAYNFLQLERWLVGRGLGLLKMLEIKGDMSLGQMEFVLTGATQPILQEFRQLLYHICDCEYGNCWQDENWQLDSLCVSWLEEIEIRILQLSAEELAQALVEHLA